MAGWKPCPSFSASLYCYIIPVSCSVSPVTRLREAKGQSNVLQRKKEQQGTHQFHTDFQMMPSLSSEGESSNSNSAGLNGSQLCCNHILGARKHQEMPQTGRFPGPRDLHFFSGVAISCSSMPSLLDSFPSLSFPSLPSIFGITFCESPILRGQIMHSKRILPHFSKAFPFLRSQVFGLQHHHGTNALGEHVAFCAASCFKGQRCWRDFFLILYMV